MKTILLKTFTDACSINKKGTVNALQVYKEAKISSTIT